MEIGLANIILNINIVLGCISLALNIAVLCVLIARDRAFRKQSGLHDGGHVKK